MGAVRLFMEEMKSLLRGKGIVISVLAAILVPLVFVGILLSPEWGPYDNLDNVPVGVVNNDRGAESFGEPLNAGDDLVENLQSNRALGWDFVTTEEAQKGLDKNEYFMIIEIPEDFSENVTTVLDDNPKKAELNFIQNEGMHYMASQVTNSAIETVHAQLSAQVTQSYVQNLFSQLKDVTEGFATAADGSSQINDGTNQLKDGTEEILSSLNGSSDSISELATGSKELEAGASELLTSLTSSQGDVARLADGARQLNEGTGEILSNLNANLDDVNTLAAGAAQVNDGTGLLLSTLQEQSGSIQELADGAQALEAGTQELQAGATQITQGLGTAKVGSEELVAGLVGQLSPGMSELADGVAELAATVQPLLGLLGLAEREADLIRMVEGAETLKGHLTPGGAFYDGLNNLDNGIGTIVAGQTQLQAGVNDLNTGASQIADGTLAVNNGWNELEKNVAVLHDGTTQVRNGNASIANGWQELAVGASQLHAGATEINQGNRTVNQGWQDLSAGASQLHNGVVQISDGNETVETGWNDLIDGVTQVDDGVGELRAGSNELFAGLTSGAESTSQLDVNEANISMFAAPVNLNGESINQFQFYRDSSVPYIMSLALFAGVIALSLIVPFRKPAVMPASGVSWFIGKAMNLSVLAILQAVLISVFALLVLRVQVESSIFFILFSIVVSLAFLMIVLFLVTLAGNIGRLIALAIIVLQLSITGSDLPIAMLPEGFRTLSTYLPLTYSIDGYTSVVSLGNFSNTFANAGVLLIYFAIFASLTMVVFYINYKRGLLENETLTTTERAS